MSELDRQHASAVLRRIARLLEVEGANPHRTRAFANAARSIESSSGDLAALVRSGEILSERGIGKGTAAVLGELLDGHKPTVLAELEERVPRGVEEMLELQGLGPKKVQAIWRSLGAENLGELQYACQENRLLELPGFGPTMQKRVLEALRFRFQNRDHVLLHDAHRAVQEACTALARSAKEIDTHLVGELRRGAETVSEPTILAVGPSAAELPGIIVAAGAEERAAEGPWTLATEAGIEVTIQVADAAAAGAALLVHSASPEHLRALEEHCLERGLRLSRDGLFRGDERLPSADEASIFAALELAFIPAELREEAETVAAAAAGRLPRLVAAEDIRGALHNHTTDSDGTASLEEMAAAAAALGWSFFGVADHSPVAVYANGVNAERLRAQGRRADAHNAAGSGLRVLKGLEADILSDGRLDLPEGAAESLDYVVASVHSGFQLGRDEQTARVIRAVSDPACRVLGHPTGRLLLARPGFEIDLEAVLDACAEHGVALEINASPYRLDLSWRWARRALEKGLKLVVNPDAHSTSGLEHLRWGLMVARRAGATPAGLLNCMEDEELRKWLRVE